MAKLSKKKKQHVFLRDNGICQYCGTFLNADNTKAWHVDHVISIKLGGNNELSNLLLACVPCNTRKSGYDLEYFRGMMAINQSQYKDVINFKQATKLESLGVELDLPDYTFFFEAQSDER